MNIRALKRQLDELQAFAEDIDGMDETVVQHEDRIIKLEGEQEENVNAYRAILLNYSNQLDELNLRIKEAERWMARMQGRVTMLEKNQ